MRFAALMLACCASIGAAGQQLQPLSPEIQALRTQLASGTTEAARVEAAFELADTDPDRSVPYFRQRLAQEESRQVRIAIINALSEIDGPARPNDRAIRYVQRHPRQVEDSSWP